MCGIVGIIALNEEAPLIEERTLIRMRDSMTHRGPDSAGIWLAGDRSAGLAHRRLSIIDLSPSAQQPMSNETESIWITFNGEIYNYLELRKELQDLGHTFRSNSDTECVIHAYEEWGTDSVHHLDGMFAFAIWDNLKEVAWLARDRLGKKPLYFAELNGHFVFASEIKAILLHPEATRTENKEALWHYLTFAATPAPLTLFAGIYKLPPAMHLSIPRTQKKWVFTEYWRPWEATDKNPKTVDEYALDIRTWLQESIERRLMSDVPFGVFLSGGVDSSTNVALMSRVMDRPVDTFSVGFSDKVQAPHNEIQYAREVAKLFKTNHHEVLIGDQHFFDFADRMAFYQDEPLADPVCVPLYYVSKLARENGTYVIQVGEGSDELFAGYDIYHNYLRREKLYWRRFQNSPRSLQKSLVKFGKAFLKPRNAIQLARAERGEPIFVSAALAFHDLEKAPLHSWNPYTSSSDLSAQAYRGHNPSIQMLTRAFPQATVISLPSFDHEAEGEGKDDLLKKIIHWECHQRLSELLLMRLDKMTMANGIEARAPFLDLQLVKLAMQIPSSMKMINGIGKAVLKKAVEPLLPNHLIYRKKIGFCGGSGNMLTPAILAFAKERILSTMPSHDWQQLGLEKVIKDHESGKSENSFQIWNLMNLALWYKKWF
jgi:asparagine synthase (glutamine-hydrolysing)